MRDVEARSEKYIDEVMFTLAQMKKDLPAKAAQIISTLLAAREAGRRIYICGNGGSASTASHMASDLNKTAARKDAKAFRAVSLADNIPVMLAWANDKSYEDIFVEQLRNHLELGDIVIGISGSGNSANVLRAIEHANKEGATTIGLTGFHGGKLAQLAKLSYVVPNNCMTQIEDLHLLIEHLIAMTIRNSPECAGKKGRP